MAYRKSADVDQRIVDLYMELKDGNKVAKELGFNDRTVYRVLAQRGVDTRTFRSDHLRRFKGSVLKELIEQYASGRSTAFLAAKYSCARITILDALVRAGVEIRGPKPRLTVEEVLKVKSLYEGGMTLAEVAAATGRAEATIMQLVNNAQISRAGIVGPGGPHWMGGKWKDRQGYVQAWVADDDLMACMRVGTYVPEHRLVMARKLGRPLLKTETVHHIDGNRANNSPANLQLRQGKHGNGTAMVCLDCGSHNIGHRKLS